MSVVNAIIIMQLELSPKDVQVLQLMKGSMVFSLFILICHKLVRNLSIQKKREEDDI
jgi:hypothetical protein